MFPKMMPNMYIARFTGRLALSCVRRSLNQTNRNLNLNLISSRNLFTVYRSGDGPICNRKSSIRLNAPVGRLCSKADEIKPEDKVKQFKAEIDRLEKQIGELKGQTADKAGKLIQIEDGKFDKRSDDEEIVYRVAYDFPGFKSKNIQVKVIDQILQVYAFQTSNKKDTKEYIYENTTEELLPTEIDVNKIKAMFDAENGFLIIEAILPDDCNLKEIQKRTRELNDNLFKLEKELEAKKKELSNVRV